MDPAAHHAFRRGQAERGPQRVEAAADLRVEPPAFGDALQGSAQRPCAPGYSLTARNGVTPCRQALPGALIGRNAGIGFDGFTVNTRLSRTFALTERLRLECMAEAFNALNHRNNLLPNTTFGTGVYPLQPNATFGRPTAVGDARSVQLAARLNF